MRQVNFKIVIFILSLVMVITIAGVSILYVTTDSFKPNELLFKKYIAQNFKNVYEVINLENEEKNIDLLRKSDYTEKTNATLKYLQNENDEEEIYNIDETGTIQNTQKQSYRKITANYSDTKLIDIDLLKKDNIYGLRLANIVQQFVSIKNATLPYFISSLGYSGEYFTESLQGVDISGIADFTNEEIQILANRYTNSVFTDINKKNYTSRSALITLSNGQSIDTTSYTLKITKNELDKIYKRILNQAISDEVILNKIQQIDEKIKETGLKEPEGKSLKEQYTSKLQEISDQIEYEGTDLAEITFTVYQTKGKTIRTAIKMQDNEYIIDLDETNGKTIIIKLAQIVEDTNQVTTISLGKDTNEQDTTRELKYEDSKQKLEINIITNENDDEIKAKTNLNYTNENISNIKFESDTNISLNKQEDITIDFNKNNNILLNDYEGTKIFSILKSLKNRTIKSLENSRNTANTKLLNNITIWIDKREQQKNDEEKLNSELKKQRFNNQFILYEGESIEYQYIQKLIKTASQNLSEYKVINGNKVRLLIQEGTVNEEKAKEISNAISEKYTYDVEIKYSDEGYVNSIDISVHKKD